MTEPSTTQLLTDRNIADAELTHWSVAGRSLVRTVELASFRAAIELVDRVAEAAEEANHHPDIDIRWKKVTFTLSTHSSQGLTQKDVDLARRIDELRS